MTPTSATTSFESLAIGDTIAGTPFAPTRETIREFCDASLDYNPLHWDDAYMKGNFGKTSFGGIIMHGMTNFGILTKMLTDWLYPMGGVHRRLETRWKAPVKPGDTIVPTGTITAKKETAGSRWAVIAVEIKNQHGTTIAQGEAMAEFPPAR
ncbi:phosphate acetyltransferase [Rhodoplanes roseus]|uniref:Phosphate acetyltransferase n=2 Tax=Rhodoplanes roseus TaxID=29409 RepID=A0A327L496_9BRAD|nr:phosphate acetyltransferase [Rhodoplanes roseus]